MPPSAANVYPSLDPITHSPKSYTIDVLLYLLVPNIQQSELCEGAVKFLMGHRAYPGQSRFNSAPSEAIVIEPKKLHAVVLASLEVDSPSRRRGNNGLPGPR